MLASAATASGCGADGVVIDGVSLWPGVLSFGALKPAKFSGTVTSNSAARLRTWYLAWRRTFQFILRMRRSVWDERRMPWTFSAESACEQGRASNSHSR